MLSYRYHEEAKAEYLADVRYYSQIDPKLGRAFVSEVEAAIMRIRESPEAQPPIGAGLRRGRIRRFRHAIIYEIQTEGIYIWAVMHTSREPGYWKKRLEKI